MSTLEVNLKSTMSGPGLDTILAGMEFNVFDSHMKFVGKILPNEGALEGLKPGAYKLTAEMPDGDTMEKLVILGSNPMEVDIDLDELMESEKSNLSSKILVPNARKLVNLQALSKTRRPVFSNQENPTVEFYTPFISTAPFNEEIELIEEIGARSERLGPGEWIFHSDSSLQVSQAIFKTHEGFVRVVLPIGGQEGSTECKVHLNHRSSRSRLDIRVEVTNSRPLVRSMLNMIDAGKAFQAGKMAMGAKDLLYSKYSDPVGATLGALILFELGKLDDRPLIDWADNLFNNFGWLTDVNVLRVATNIQHNEFSINDFHLLLASSSKPIIFTKIYSLMVRHLRNWRSEITEAEDELRLEALKKLANINPAIDWSAPTVVLRKSADEVQAWESEL